MDYGIISLVAIALAAAGLCVHLAAQLKGELRTIDLLRIDTVEAKRLALESNERTTKIETDHYHQLRRQLLDLVEDLKSAKSDFLKSHNQLVTLQGTVGRMKQQFQAADKGETPTGEGGAEDVIPPPANYELPKINNRPLLFGSRRRAA